VSRVAESYSAISRESIDFRIGKDDDQRERHLLDTSDINVAQCSLLARAVMIAFYRVFATLIRQDMGNLSHRRAGAVRNSTVHPLRQEGISRHPTIDRRSTNAELTLIRRVGSSNRKEEILVIVVDKEDSFVYLCLLSDRAFRANRKKNITC